ncbi:MAG: HD family phosphohydrolase [Clostridia bacterium]|nr:HD family phosphohydrolase [Clostridia bacterium]
MKISKKDRSAVRESLTGIIETPQAQSMKTFIQHGHITTYTHVMNVVCMSCLVDERLHAHCDKRSLIRGAFLHDFYLYDWHDPTSNDGLHGFKHPVRALNKAEALFRLNPKERNIIVSHMWPMTLTRIPKCREAAIVCLSDKLCALYETVWKDKSLFDIDIQ